MTTTLETVSGIQARIYTLPNRPPFMTAADLAEVYGTTPKRIGEAVKRNPARFPERYAFRLSEVEEQQMRSQFATTYGKKREDVRPLVLTHGGANMLASVLRGDVAVRMAVAINDAFTQMEQDVLAETTRMLAKLRIDISKRPIYHWCVEAERHGWSFEKLFKATNYSRWKLEQAIMELVGMGLMQGPLPGMQLRFARHA